MEKSMRIPKIYSDIPVPPRHETDNRSKGRWVNLLRDMNVGDCVILTHKDCLSISATAARHKIKLVKKFSDHNGEEDMYMVWRVAK